MICDGCKDDEQDHMALTDDSKVLCQSCMADEYKITKQQPSFLGEKLFYKDSSLDSEAVNVKDLIFIMEES